MPILNLIRIRLGRGLTIRSIGPNEARILFDAIAGFVSAIAAVSFCRLFRAAPIELREIAFAVTLPLLFIFFNLTLGVYSRFRLALARVKALVLCTSVGLSGLAGWAAFRELWPIVLWAMLLTGPVVLARLLLSLHAGRHRVLTRIVVNRRGPVLVMGGAGYIGSHTVDLLLKSGHEVRVLDRMMYGGAALADFRSHPRFALIEGDVTDISKLTAAVRDCSAVVHLAGLVGDPACAVNPEFTRHANIISTRMAREVAEAMGVHRFIFASSCSVYGVSEKEVSETDSFNPVSLYAQTKIDSEKELLQVVRDDFFVTVLRFATVFGHSRRPRFDLVANLFTAQALANGLITVIGPQQWRPFIHVRDLARAIVMVLDAEPRVIQSQIFNVGDKRLNFTLLQLAEKVRDVCRRHRDVSISVSENAADRRNYAVSFQKIHSLLGFEASTLLEPGIEEMAAALSTHQYNYLEQVYSNVAMTTRALSEFQNDQSHLYAPLKAHR